MMPMDISTGNPVIEEMSEEFSKKDGYYRCKVEETDSFVTVPVATNRNGLGEEDGGADVDADRPCENEQTGEVSV